MKTKKNIQSMPIHEKKKKKNCCEDKDVDLLLIEEKNKKHYVFISIHSYMIILYMVKKNIFVVIFCKILSQKKY